MIKAGTTIKAPFSKMIHVICLVHGIQVHRVVENIRGKFPEIDKLIAKNQTNIFQSTKPNYSF
jgi:hypothetical protein